jgi:hypothetical protein
MRPPRSRSQRPPPSPNSAAERPSQPLYSRSESRSG